ncbi:hypothetical protein OIU76_016120 [Salix suchowensis]|nr:hypothetical protein OIU76_016120 [Salix suchowensis]
MLSEVQLRSTWNFWERRYLPLLCQNDHPWRQTQVPLNRFIFFQAWLVNYYDNHRSRDY